MRNNVIQFSSQDSVLVFVVVKVLQRSRTNRMYIQRKKGIYFKEWDNFIVRAGKSKTCRTSQQTGDREELMLLSGVKGV